MTRRDVALAALLGGIGLAGLLLALGPTTYRVGLDSVVELWGDLVRDVDRAGLAVTRVSAEREMEVGREIEREFLRHWRPADDPAARAYVEAVGAPIAEAVRRAGIDYRFHVVQSPMVNAFAIPGGGVFVTTGMLEFLESEAELATVLGHEVAHVDLGHAIERLQYELALREVGLGDLTIVARIGYGLVGLGFSEQQELEADGRGAILAAASSYDPRAALSVFGRMSERDGGSTGERERPRLMTEELGRAVGDAVGDYFSTHPPADRRLANLDRVIARNARAWRNTRFYLGRWNHRARVPRAERAVEGEWRDG
jgi:predicted Zn-dependent protease